MSWSPCPAPCASERREKPRLRANRHPAGAPAIYGDNCSRQGCFSSPLDCYKSAANQRIFCARERSRGPPARSDRPAAQRAHPIGVQKRVQPPHQLGSHEVELLRPDGRRAGDRKPALALPRGLRLRRHELAHRVRPDALAVAQERERREALAERRDGATGRPGLPAPHAARAGAASIATLPGATRSRTTPAAAAPGTCARSVVVMTL